MPNPSSSLGHRTCSHELQKRFDDRHILLLLETLHPGSRTEDGTADFRQLDAVS